MYILETLWIFLKFNKCYKNSPVFETTDVSLEQGFPNNGLVSLWHCFFTLVKYLAHLCIHVCSHMRVIYFDFVLRDFVFSAFSEGLRHLSRQGIRRKHSLFIVNASLR